jgi:hypothetical protein
MPQDRSETAKKYYQLIRIDILKNGLETSLGLKLTPAFILQFFSKLSDIHFYYLYQFFKSDTREELWSREYINKGSVFNNLQFVAKFFNIELRFFKADYPVKFLNFYGQTNGRNLDTNKMFQISKRKELDELLSFLQEEFFERNLLQVDKKADLKQNKKTEIFESQLDLFDIVSQNWTWDNNQYPQLPEDPSIFDRRKNFQIRHILLHSMKHLGVVASAAEEFEHKDFYTNEELELIGKSAVKLMINNIKLLEIMGLDEVETKKQIEQFYRNR